MKYQPGTHLIATLITEEKTKLEVYDSFKQLIDHLTIEHRLEKLGEVYHNFLPAGFTGIVCLSESHISVHTWPEHGRLNIDIYLSNFLRSNDGTVLSFHEAITAYFNAEVTQQTLLIR